MSTPVGDGSRTSRFCHGIFAMRATHSQKIWKCLRIQWLQLTVQNRVVGCIELHVSCVCNGLCPLQQKNWKVAAEPVNQRSYLQHWACATCAGPGSIKLIPCPLERFSTCFTEPSSSLCVRTIAWKTPSWHPEHKAMPIKQTQIRNCTKTRRLKTIQTIHAWAMNHSDVQLRSWQMTDLWLQQNYLPPHNVRLVRRFAGLSKHLTFHLRVRVKFQDRRFLVRFRHHEMMSKNPEDGRCNLGVILETLTLRPAPNNLCHDRFCNLAPAVHLLCRRAVLPCKVPLFKTWSINHCGSQIRLGRLGQQFSSNLGRNHLQPSLEPGKNKQLGLKRKTGVLKSANVSPFP